jgi:hypothetical protein
MRIRKSVVSLDILVGSTGRYGIVDGGLRDAAGELGCFRTDGIRLCPVRAM